MPFCAPQIVYSNSWKGQTAALPGVYVYTNSGGDGLFRVSVALFCQSSTASSPSVSATASWEPSTTVGGGVGFTLAGSSLQSPGYFGTANGQTAPIAAGGRVSINTSVGSIADLSYYDLYLVVEQLA